MMNRVLFAIFWCFILTGINVAYAGGALDEGNLPYEDNLKVFPHWIISCNNLNECRGIGYPIKGGDNIEQPWYIVVNWAKGSDVADFSVPYYLDRDIIPSAKLCENNGQCRKIDIKDKLQTVIDKNSESSGQAVRLNFILNVAALSLNSYITFSQSQNDSIYLGEFLQNRNSIKINHMMQLGGKEKIYKWQSHNERIATKNISKFYPQYNKNNDNWCDGYDDYTDTHIVTYENGAVFMFLPCNEGYDTIISKYNGKVYKNFNVLDNASYTITAGSIAQANTFGFVKLDKNDKTIFKVSSMQCSHFYFALVYDMAYNGKKFIIEKIRYMPLCMNIDFQDWPIVYQRPQ